MATDLIRYDLLVQDALRSVVRKVLADAARNGLLGHHRFDIAFETHAPGVVAPAAVKQRFPDEMSIILQHEFWDLAVTQDAFEVSLNFSSKPERLIVPLELVAGFHRSVRSVRLQTGAARSNHSDACGRGGKAADSGPSPGKADASQAVRQARPNEIRSNAGKASEPISETKSSID